MAQPGDVIDYTKFRLSFGIEVCPKCGEKGRRSVAKGRKGLLVNFTHRSYVLSNGWSCPPSDRGIESPTPDSCVWLKAERGKNGER